MFTSKVYKRLFFNLLSLQSRCYFCRQPIACQQHNPRPDALWQKTHTALATPITVGPTHICAGCFQDLPWLEHCCHRCAEPLPPSLASGSKVICGRCLKHSPAFDRTCCPLNYEFPVNRLVNQLKDHADAQVLQLASKLFCERWQSAICQQPPEYLIPVPLHPKRLYGRGYNQSLELARGLSGTLAIPLAPHTVSRTLATEDQKSLDAKSRRRNLQKAFAVQPDFVAQHVTIVDDVMTTGSTVDAIARLLKQSGVERVDVWCLARTPMSR